MSPEPLRHLFQWSDNEGEVSGYTCFATISSVQIWFVSANIADNNNDDLRHYMKAQKQIFRTQQEALDNIQSMLAQLLNNRNNDETGNHPNEEGNLNNEPPETEQSKEGSSINVDVIKGIQGQIASLTQSFELKKLGNTHPYPMEWDSVPYPSKFKPPTLHTYGDKSSLNQHIYYFRSQTNNIIDNDAIIARLFIGTLKG